MTRSRIFAIAVFAFAALILVANSVFIVPQTQQVLVLRLGTPARIVNRPGTDESGLQIKIPFMENLVRFDKRNQFIERDKEEITSSDQEKMDVDAFLVYRISDPLAFYRSATNDAGGQVLLQRVVNSALREALGTATTEEIVATKRDALMRQVRDDVARRVTASRFGVQVVDLRIKRADLPAQNAEAVFVRMQTQRQQEAQQLRAEGEQKAKDVLGEASKEAETTIGEADAEKSRLLAAAYGKDPGFAAFYRTMRAYDTALANPDRPIILSPDSEFFRYMKQGPGAGK